MASTTREQTAPRPLVLLSNDDGYRARGIQALAGALSSFAEVVVCAPSTEQSTTSHALSLGRPLRLEQVGPNQFAVDGTPADSVYVALHTERVLPRPPSLIVSGLNHGLNLGNDVFYSGTVAAAREGALRGLPAMAVSAAAGADFLRACRVTSNLARAVIEHGKPPLLLNVNFPAQGSWELRETRLGNRAYQDEVEFRLDPRGREYLWIGGSVMEHARLEDSDTDAHDQGLVGVTPLVLDLWDRASAQLTRTIVEASQGA